MNEAKRITNDGATSSFDTKKSPMLAVVQAGTGKHSPAKRRPRRDLQTNRSETRESMLYQVNMCFDMMTDKLFYPTKRYPDVPLSDVSDLDDFLRPPSPDNVAMRLHASVQAEVNELRRQMVNLVRRASMVRGPAARQALRVIVGGGK